MTKEKFPPMKMEILLSKGECCGRGCVNCPYDPRHGGERAIKIDEGWVEWKKENPEGVYEEYLRLKNIL